MKLSQLLQQREALLRQVRLANLAYAYWQLGLLVTRITGARVRGLVRLQPADPALAHSWPVLTALEGRQSVIEEHFTDEAVAELSGLLIFLRGEDGADLTFRLEEMTAQFLTPLRQELVQSGVEIESAPLRLAAPNQKNSHQN
jgi:hypothetical protein